MSPRAGFALLAVVVSFCTAYGYLAFSADLKTNALAALTVAEQTVTPSGEHDQQPTKALLVAAFENVERALSGSEIAHFVGTRGVKSGIAAILCLVGAFAIFFFRQSRRRQLGSFGFSQTKLLEIDFAEGAAPETRDLVAELHSLGAEIRRQIGDLSHEMRTPLAVIAGSASAVRRELPREAGKGRRSADLIALSAERLVDLLDAHRDQTDQLLDSFLGSQATIDVGAFVQNFIVHARVSTHVASVHPPKALYVRTQAGSLKEILGLLLVEAETGMEPNQKKLSLARNGNWIQIIIKYHGPGTVRPLTVIPGVELALSSQRVRLSLMGATLRRTLDDDGLTCVTLALPAEITLEE